MTAGLTESDLWTDGSQTAPVPPLKPADSDFPDGDSAAYSSSSSSSSTRAFNAAAASHGLLPEIAPVLSTDDLMTSTPLGAALAALQVVHTHCCQYMLLLYYSALQSDIACSTLYCR